MRVCVFRFGAEGFPKPGEGGHEGERLLAPVVKCFLGHWLDEGFSLIFSGFYF